MRVLKFIIPLAATVSAVVLGILVWGNKTFLFNEPSYAKSGDMTTNQSEDKPHDPCWYQTREGIESVGPGKLTKMRDRQMYGYETEIPLSEAVRIFNEELTCNPIFKTYPPLTEDELIGALAAGEITGSRDKFWKIALDKKLPKSSILYFGGHGLKYDTPLNPNGFVNDKGIWIYLVVDLDPEHGHKTVKPEQRLLIRQIVTGIEIRQ